MADLSAITNYLSGTNGQGLSYWQNTAAVDEAFMKALGRAPSFADREYYGNLISQGAQVDGLISNIQGSPEAQSFAASGQQNGYTQPLDQQKYWDMMGVINQSPEQRAQASGLYNSAFNQTEAGQQANGILGLDANGQWGGNGTQQYGQNQQQNRNNNNIYKNNNGQSGNTGGQTGNPWDAGNTSQLPRFNGYTPTNGFGGRPSQGWDGWNQGTGGGGASGTGRVGAHAGTAGIRVARPLQQVVGGGAGGTRRTF
jgi:hypothetical protein